MNGPSHTLFRLVADQGEKNKFKKCGTKFGLYKKQIYLCVNKTIKQ